MEGAGAPCKRCGRTVDIFLFLMLLQFIWTPYTLPVWGGLCPAWVSEEGEVEIWRASVSIVCFMFVQYHPADRVKRQFGFEQPIPVNPVNFDKFLTFNARGEDKWWPTKLDEYYGHWMARRTVDHQIRVVYTPDTTIPTREYAEWWGRVCKARYLSGDEMLHDPRFARLPKDAPLRATQPRDSIVLPTKAPAPRRRAGQQRPDIRRKKARMGQGGQQRPLGGEEIDEDAEHHR
ncbi:hypothetical protein PIB30_077928 [Stylosanthes scabra]|uniref:Aminotransferase-like plant mobile domain-containing protein n=1 Tax=Stylosanthes scabra TaxID=79078 RepID=A0ABU6SQS0_9FABA|nr:hypothetical protein [Stylosanthes scabra]